MKNAQVQLFDQMLSVFSEENIIELCFRLNIDYDDLNGKNRRAKTISLIESCQQSDRLAELVELCQNERPAVSWPTAAELSAGQPESNAAFVQALDEAVQSDEPTKTPEARPAIKISRWGWGMAGLLLLALAVLFIWKPWARSAEPAVFSPSTTNTIDLNQTVSGKITGTGAQTWTYTGPREEVDIRVEGGPDDTFVLILAYKDGGQADYVDYSGRGEGELLKYYDLQEGMRIVVDETENEGAEYTLSVTKSDWKYLWPGENYGGEIRGANPEGFLYGGDPRPVDIILEMTNAEQPLLEVYKPDGRLLISENQLDENGRLTLTHLELTGEDQYKIIVRDQANNGATYQIAMRASDGG
jgi:hypothetical protein